MPVSGLKRFGGLLTRHGREGWSVMGGGWVNVPGGEGSGGVPGGLQASGCAGLGGLSWGVVPCVMDGGETLVGISRCAVAEGWGTSCGHVGGDSGLGRDGCSTVLVGRDSAGDCGRMEGMAGV